MSLYLCKEEMTENGGYLVPIRELIQCKECKHSEPWYRDRMRCFLWHETGIDVWSDGFCNYAERKDE